MKGSILLAVAAAAAIVGGSRAAVEPLDPVRAPMMAVDPEPVSYARGDGHPADSYPFTANPIHASAYRTRIMLPVGELRAKPNPPLQVPDAIRAYPWAPMIVGNDTTWIPGAYGAGGAAGDSIIKLIIEGSEPPGNVWILTEKVGDYGGSQPPGNECNRDVPGTFANIVDSLNANQDQMNFVVTLGTGNYIRCNAVLDNMPASRNVHYLFQRGEVLFNNPRWRFNSTTRDMLIRNATFRNSQTGAVTFENVSRSITSHISSAWANHSGSGGQYVWTSQTSLGNPTNPQSDITVQYGLFYEGAATGPRLYAIGGGSPRMDCPEILRHTGWRNVSYLGGRQPLIGCVGTPVATDPSTYNNGALLAQCYASGVVDRGTLIQQEVLGDIMGCLYKARVGAQRDLGRDTRVIVQAGCSNAGGDSPRGDEICLQSIYASGNRFADPDIAVDIQYGVNDDAQWAGTDSLLVCRVNSSDFGDLVGVVDSTSLGNYCARDGEKVAPEVRRNTPQTSAVTNGDYLYPDTATLTDQEWEDKVFNLVGNSFWVDNSGNIVPRRDSIDAEVIEWQTNHLFGRPGPTGHGVSYLGIVGIGGYQLERTPGDTIHVRNDLLPDTSVAPCTDADNDGMCLEAEIRYGLSDSDPNDGWLDHDGDWFLTNIEVWSGSNPLVYDGHDPPGGGVTVPPSTYGTEIRAHLATLKDEIQIAPNGDTTIFCTGCVVFPESVSYLSAAPNNYRLILLAESLAILETRDTLDPTTSYALLDSAQVDSLCAAYNLTRCPEGIRAGTGGRNEQPEPPLLLQQASLSPFDLYTDPPARARGWAKVQ